MSMIFDTAKITKSGITPLHEIRDELLLQKKVRLFIKRDDIVHSTISGNKWRKLKYNLQEAKGQKKKTLLTFGGAFSNHIHAVAAAGKEYGFYTIGIIRGEEITGDNATLTFARECGMQLHFISREVYRQKEEQSFIEKLHPTFGDFYLLPEGGTNVLAVKGCAEIPAEISIDYHYLCCACGTGGTLAGLIAGNKDGKKVVGFSVLKGMKDLEEKITKLLSDFAGKSYDNWSVNHDYDFGGYAKWNDDLIHFIKDFHSSHQILLDPVYTGKMLFGIFDLIVKNYFPGGSTIVAIHTGGLQGWVEKIKMEDH
jgi:1-aminocyclopropane-1-carboxylate deaminase